jgi:serine/threonine protein phosphatase PrpC
MVGFLGVAAQILASDGLWDIMGNLAAARVVDRCIKKGERSLASQR